MSPSRSPRSAVYELTVVGTLGPVLRSALASYATASSEVRTVLRTEVAGRGDLVDLVRALDSRGLEITDIVDVT